MRRILTGSLTGFLAFAVAASIAGSAHALSDPAGFYVGGYKCKGVANDGSKQSFTSVPKKGHIIELQDNMNGTYTLIIDGVNYIGRIIDQGKKGTGVFRTQGISDDPDAFGETEYVDFTEKGLKKQSIYSDVNGFGLCKGKYSRDF